MHLADPCQRAPAASGWLLPFVTDGSLPTTAGDERQKATLAMDLHL